MKNKLKVTLSILAVITFLLPVAANATTTYVGPGRWDHGHTVNAWGHYVYSNLLYPTWHSSTAKMSANSGTYSSYDSCSTYNWSNAATEHTWSSVNSTSAYYNF